MATPSSTLSSSMSTSSTSLEDNPVKRATADGVESNQSLGSPLLKSTGGSTPKSIVVNKKGTTATMRLKQDYLRIMKDPVPFITAHPLPSNILEWHYVVKGPENSSYEGGVYHGKLSFPSEFPFKPPSIIMITPNGRFKCNTRLCLSISDYHPDTWNPAWSVSTILTGLLSFMLEKNPTMGSVETSEYEKKQLAKKSWDFNLKNEIFKELFPDIVSEINEKKKRIADEEKMKRSTTVTDKVSELTDTIRSHGIRNNNNSNADANNPDGDSLFSNLISNVVVVVVFAAFVYTVRYVLLTISQDNNHNGSSI